MTKRISKLKYLDVSTQIIADILKLASKNALPKDAQIMRVNYEALTDCWRLIIHSKKFDPIPEGSLIPKLGNPVISSGILK